MFCMQKVMVAMMSLPLVLALPGAALAGVKTTAVRETIEWLSSKFSSRITREGAEALAPKLERLVVKHGDEVLPPVRRYGPDFVEALEQAGPKGKDLMRLVARHGDDALRITGKPSRVAMFARYGDDVEQALLKHPAMAEELINKFGAPAGRALKDLDGRQARRLVDMSRSGDLARIGRTDEVLDVMARFGDRACDFVWRNKGALATATVLAAFLTDPKSFIDGGRDLSEIAAKHLAQPAIDATGQLAADAAARTNWTLVAVAAVLAVSARRLWRSRARRTQLSA